MASSSVSSSRCGERSDYLRLSATELAAASRQVCRDAGDETVMKLARGAHCIGMKMQLRALILPALLLASCAAPAVVTSSPTTSPTVAAATAVATAVAPVVTVAPPPIFAASECTSGTATARQVIERYFALSTSNNAQAVTDCFAKSWRDKSAQFADSAALWSHSGPATSVVVTAADAVNGCDRFRVTAQMPNDSFWMRGQTGGQGFFSVGAEAGRVRIYEIATALANASLTTLRCG